MQSFSILKFKCSVSFRVNLILCEGDAFCGENSKKSSLLKDRGWRMAQW